MLKRCALTALAVPAVLAVLVIPANADTSVTAKSTANVSVECPLGLAVRVATGTALDL